MLISSDCNFVLCVIFVLYLLPVSQNSWSIKINYYLPNKQCFLVGRHLRKKLFRRYLRKKLFRRFGEFSRLFRWLPKSSSSRRLTGEFEGGELHFVTRELKFLNGAPIRFRAPFCKHNAGHIFQRCSTPISPHQNLTPAPSHQVLGFVPEHGLWQFWGNHYVPTCLWWYY